MALPERYLSDEEERARLRGLPPLPAPAPLNDAEVPSPPDATPVTAAPEPVQETTPQPPAIMRGLPQSPEFGRYMREEAASPDQQSGGDDTWRKISGFLAGFAGTGEQNQKMWQQHDAEIAANKAKSPGSAESQRARASYAPLLKQMGMTDDEIAHLSASDIAQVNQGGNLVEGLMRARQAASNAKAAKANQIEEEIRTGNTAADKEKRAQTIAGNQTLQAQYNDQLTRAREAESRQAGYDLKNKGAEPVDLPAEYTKLTEAFKDSESGKPPDALVARLQGIGKLPEDRRQDALLTLWKDVESEKGKPKSFSDPLRYEDIADAGWVVGEGGEKERASTERWINKRALTKEISGQLTSTKTSLESLDRLIANRKKYGSNVSGSSQGRSADDRFYFATAKANYQKAMGIPNTNEGKAEVDHIFAIDPAAVSGTGVMGAIQGVASQVGLADDPVLQQLQSIRDEADHNMISKIPIPHLHLPDREIPAWPGKITQAPSSSEKGRKSGARRRPPMAEAGADAGGMTEDDLALAKELGY